MSGPRDDGPVTDETVRMRQELVRLEVESLCGPRLAPVADVDLPEHVAVHRVTTWAGDDLPCSAAEAQVWDDAARGCLDVVSRALERLYRAHGGTQAQVDLANGTRSWRHLTPPSRLPVLRQRAAQRSADAQREFAAEVEAATAAYRPVHERIATLVEESRAALQAAQLRRTQVVQEAARRRCWVVRDDDGTVRVGRIGGAGGTDTATALTAAELERTLATLLPADGAEPVWEPSARADLERECRAAGVEIGFAQWWDTVTEGRCRRRRETHQRVRHGTAHHSSYGVGGHSTSGTSF